MKCGECKVGMMVQPIQPTAKQLAKEEFKARFEWRVGRIGVVLRVHDTKMKVPVVQKKDGTTKKKRVIKAYVRWFRDGTQQWINTQFLEKIV